MTFFGLLKRRQSRAVSISTTTTTTMTTMLKGRYSNSLVDEVDDYEQDSCHSDERFRRCSKNSFDSDELTNSTSSRNSSASRSVQNEQYPTNLKNNIATTTVSPIPTTTIKSISTKESTDHHHQKDQEKTNDVSGSNSNSIKEQPPRKQQQSLEERSRVPGSLYIVLCTILGLHISSGVYTMTTIQSYYQSIVFATLSLNSMIQYVYQLVMQTTTFVIVSSSFISESLSDSDMNQSSTTTPSLTEYIRVGFIVLICSLLLYVFFIAPFRAGFWTGPRTKKHKLHRYLGLLYLFHYTFAVIEYFTNYDMNRTTYLCHFCALNGIIQGVSAYFSFKVLPELKDPGYYSDQAVLSRKFVHENIFFTTMAVFGSIYFIHDNRKMLKSNLIGQLIEHIYIFWPYVFIRPWFPTTSFSNAGTTRNGRSKQNQTFYRIGTTLVKIFYLWAKYFFGFFINYAVYLNLITNEKDWKLLHGMLLLNSGTASLSVFLHTLRFKKVLPPKFTFTLYLIEIYLSFLAVPVAYKLFIQHPRLCYLCVTGLLTNLANSPWRRRLHTAWCMGAMLLITQTNIEW